MSAPLPPHLRTTLRLQHLSLFWERLWAALQRPFCIIVLICALLWSGLLASFAPPIPLGIMVLLALALLSSLWPLSRLRRPSGTEVLRTLDHANNLGHREASSLSDTLVPESQSQTIWDEYLRRKLATLGDLSLAWPLAAWRKIDPLALRAPIILLAVCAFFLGRGEIVSGSRNALALAPPPPAVPTTLDAWLKPPVYTGKPPILLTSPAMSEKLKTETEIVAPENSILNLRLGGVSHPQVTFLSPGTTDNPVNLSSVKIEKGDGGLTADIKLDRPVTVKISDGDKELALYPFSLVPDQPPKIDFGGDPQAGGQGKLAVKWKASDDYGLKSVSAEISLADEQEGGVTGFDSNGVFLYDAPEFKVALKHPGAKEDATTTTADLTGHPWAGLYVEMVLTATDGAGHKTSTQPKRFKLPERAFIKPLAQALVEQRKKVIMVPEAAPDAATLIGSMLLYPVDIADNSGLILNLAAVDSRLGNASSPDDVVGVVKDLWPLIVAVDSGKLDDAKKELQALTQQLQQALREGASQDKIDELMRRMRDAMDRLMSEMQKQGQQMQAQGQDAQQPERLITPDELQQMMDQIGKLSQQGKEAEAQDMLSQLDQMLQNLRPGPGKQANGQSGAQDQLNELQGLMGKQRRLMDQTQRLGRDGEPNDGPGLAGKQQQLGDDLEKFGQGLGTQDGGDHLGNARRNMDGAQNALRDGDRDGALKQQNQALRDMLKGMGKLADQLKKQGQGNLGAKGEHGDGEDDPLGRPRATRDPGLGPNKDIVPSELAMRRAREILEELRGRANEEGLDAETRSYIDRLLKNVY